MIKRAETNDLEILAKLAVMMWQNHSVNELMWAKENPCHEFASDCEIDNINSFHFHKAMNFTEANRIICFTKTL